MCGGSTGKEKQPEAASPHLSRPVQTEFDVLNVSQRPMYNWKRPFLESDPEEVFILKPGGEVGDDFRWTKETCLGEQIKRIGAQGSCAHIRVYGEYNDSCATGFGRFAIGFYHADKEKLRAACSSKVQYTMLTELDPFFAHLSRNFTILKSKVFAWIDETVFCCMCFLMHVLPDACVS